MSSFTPELLPVQHEAEKSFLPQEVSGERQSRNEPSPGRRPNIFLRGFGFLFAWTWRWLVGAALCMNYFLGIFVAGWMYRWIQSRVLRNWWKKSRFARNGSFQDFCAGLGLDAPNPRPRWFLRERIRAVLAKPAPNGNPAGVVRQAMRCLTIPWHSLWLNFKTGVSALFCTYLLTGWGCLLMLFGWMYGWSNSYHKVYEEAGIGFVVGFTGILLFIAALYYVLMAQVHQAVVGTRMAFFDFHFVWRLIQVKPTAYFFLFLLMTLVSLPLEILKVALVGPQTFGNDPALSDAEVLQYLQLYTFACCLFFFAMLLLIRRLAANIYSSAVLKALQKGRIARSEVPPKLDAWLEQLEIYPVPSPVPSPIVKTARAVVRWKYRIAIYILIFLVGFVFTFRRLAGEFFIYHPVAGFMNHELVQLPAFDLITGTPASQAKDKTGQK